MFWLWRSEYRGLALWFIFFIPGFTGQWVRRKLLRHYLRSIGDDMVMHDRCWLTNPENISFGSHCNFAKGVFITGGGGVTIGNYVGFGPDTKVWSVNHRFEDPDTPWQLQGYDKLPVVIEDDVWLGADCFVMPGVTIGRGAILSAGTILMKSVPPFAIVAGNPGRVVGWRKRPAVTATEE